MFIVYILFSKKLNRFYVGFTENFDKRLDFHRDKAQSRKFTYNAEDWEVYLKINCVSKSQGLSIEKHIKSMKSKTYIENLLKYPEMILKLKSRYN